MSKRYSLLYVDDEESNLRIFRTSFKRFYDIYVATSGEEGLRILRENHIDLILTDQKMPEMTGVEFLKLAIKENSHAYRIIVTGFSDTESIIQAINECGIYQYVTKPWKNEEMQFLIDKALEAYQMKTDNMMLMSQLQEANEDLETKVVDRTRQLQESRDLLLVQNKKITDSINYAKRIQTALLPDAARFAGMFSNSFVLYQPRDIISGDFYWLDITTEGQILLALADCTGHGVPGAFMTLIGNELLNSIVNTEGIEAPNIILERLHQHVVTSLKQDDTQSKDGMDIVICRIDVDEKKMLFSGGKNSMFIVRNGVAEEIKGDRHSIGGSTKDGETRKFTQHEIDMSTPAAYYLFTDGYIDQFGGEEARKFMRFNFKKLVERISSKPMQEQGQILEQTMKSWMGDKHPQIDDITVIGFQM
jgi:CheY-like chemotaxis protein